MKPFIIVGCFMALTFSLRAASATVETADSMPRRWSKTWQLEKYYMFNVVYFPSTRQQRDQLALKRDSTFLMIDEGNKLAGRWERRSDAIVLHPARKGATDIVLSIKKRTCHRLVYSSSLTNGEITLYMANPAWLKKQTAHKAAKTKRKAKKKKS